MVVAAGYGACQSARSGVVGRGSGWGWRRLHDRSLAGTRRAEEMTGAARLIFALPLCAMLPAQPLRELAAKRGVHIGAAANPALLREAPYAETLAREFDQLEPENAMKFG